MNLSRLKHAYQLTLSQYVQKFWMLVAYQKGLGKQGRPRSGYFDKPFVNSSLNNWTEREVFEILENLWYAVILVFWVVVK